MPKIICDQCKKDIGQENHFELKAPTEYCDKCKSQVYADYRFCSKECAIEFLKDWD